MSTNPFSLLRPGLPGASQPFQTPASSQFGADMADTFSPDILQAIKQKITAPPETQSSWMNGFFGNDKQMGWGMGTAKIGKSLMDGFLGWKQYQMAQDQFGLQKDMFNKNWKAQTTDYNRQVTDQANARASATGDFSGAKEYIADNRIS